MHQSVIDAIGNTPLIRLRRASEETGCTILGKAEFLNPGQSVKDRAALFIIRDAEKKGLLKPGGVIVEGTAGNTGIGLSMVARRARLPLGDRDPGNAVAGKEGCAAPVRSRTDRGSCRPRTSNPNNYVRLSGRLAEQMAKSEPNGAIWANQFDNIVNRQAHVETTAPEIWRDTRWQCRRLSSAPSAPAAHLPASPKACARRTTGHQDRSSPTRWAQRSIPTTRPASSSRKVRPSPKASARAASPPTWKASSPISLARSPMTRRLKVIFALAAGGRHGPGRLDRHQRRWRHPAGQGTRPRPHHRDDAVRLRQTAISRSCSIRPFCARRACRFRNGWKGRPGSIFLTWRPSNGIRSQGTVPR